MIRLRTLIIVFQEYNCSQGGGTGSVAAAEHMEDRPGMRQGISSVRCNIVESTWSTHPTFYLTLLQCVDGATQDRTVLPSAYDTSISANADSSEAEVALKINLGQFPKRRLKWSWAYIWMYISFTHSCARRKFVQCDQPLPAWPSPCSSAMMRPGSMRRPHPSSAAKSVSAMSLGLRFRWRGMEHRQSMQTNYWLSDMCRAHGRLCAAARQHHCCARQPHPHCTPRPAPLWVRSYLATLELLHRSLVRLTQPE